MSTSGTTLLHLNSQDDTAGKLERDGSGSPEKTVLNSGGSANDGHIMSLPCEVLFVTIVCMAQVFTQAALGQIIAPLHIIGNNLGTSDPAQLSWFAAAYSLTVGTFILPSGRLGDMYGHKQMFMLGFLWCGVWATIAGITALHPSLVFFDFCRALQGVGLALALPNGVAILGRTYPVGPRKNIAFGLFAGCAPAGFLLGAAFASLLAQVTWWPWLFWAMGLASFGVAGLALFTIPADRNKAKGTQFDLWGAVSGCLGLILVNIAFNQGPVAGWRTPYVPVLLVLGLIVLGIFAFIESRAAAPLVPPSIFTRRTSFILACIAFGWASFGIWVYYSWQFLEIIRGQTPLLTTAQFVPVGIVGFIAAFVTARLLPRFGPGIIMCLAMIGFFTSAVLVATNPPNQIYWIQTFLSLITAPWGMDMSFPAATIVLSDNVPPHQQGVAASLVTTVVSA